MTREEEIRRVVKGFLVPVFAKPSATGGTLHGVRPRDFDKVKAGYACSVCMAEFREVRVKCPVCGHVRDVEFDFSEPPSFWLDYLKERDLDVAPPKPEIVMPGAAVDQHLKQIGAAPPRPSSRKPKGRH